jgi:hypothetical protein
MLASQVTRRSKPSARPNSGVHCSSFGASRGDKQRVLRALSGACGEARGRHCRIECASVADGHSWTKDGPDAAQNFRAGAWIPLKNFLGRCIVFIASKHGFQPQSRTDQHRLPFENLGIAGHVSFKLFFHRCHVLIFALTGWFVQSAHAGEFHEHMWDGQQPAPANRAQDVVNSGTLRAALPDERDLMR